MKKFSDDFLYEVLKLSLNSKKFLEVCIEHLKYEYLPNEIFKRVWQQIYNHYSLSNSIISIGVLFEIFNNERNLDTKEKLIGLLTKIKKTKIPDNKESVIVELESYIKGVMFVKLHTEMKVLWEKGESKKAISLLSEKSDKINTFSIKDNYYQRLFYDFDKRQRERLQNEDEKVNQKIPFGIHELDYDTEGGAELGTGVLYVSPSGVGKTTILRWHATTAARKGYNVLHLQAEGTERHTFEGYDACWSGIPIRDIKTGVLSLEKEKELNKTVAHFLNHKGEIFIKAFEQFDSASISDCRNILDDIEKLHGKIDMIVFDYLELFEPMGKSFSNNESGERRRREKVANQMINFAVENNRLVATAVQSTSIPFEKRNDPDFVITENNIAEFKGVIKPFSYVITLNQTIDEYKKNIIRLHQEKFRHSGSKKTITIYQAREVGRFYDSRKTLENLL